MKKNRLIICILAIFLLFVWAIPAGAHTEPLMADYTVYPIFNSQSVPPNIMIILDNSGSMNFNAYGTYPGDDQTVTDAPFTGEPYSGIKTFQVTSSQDDAEEKTAAGSELYYNHSDLDLGGFSVSTNDSIVGIRFQNVAIPSGATIHSAYLEFSANASNEQTTNLLIEGEASDDAAPFTAAADNLKNRIATTNTVSWDNVQAWTAGQTYPTPDISAVVQEIVDRSGWSKGNSMVFRFTGVGTSENKRDICACDASSSTAPKLHVVFGNDPDATRYYGYFNPDYFYSYDSKFNPAYKKIGYNFKSSRWEVETVGGAPATLTDAQIVSEELWDGNWLNWLCMRRIDVLRKVLMGGLVTSRTGGGNETVYGETPKQTSRVFKKVFNSSITSATSPYDGNYSYTIAGGYIEVSNTQYNIRVQKDTSVDPQDFNADSELVGVLQRVGDKARWGNIWFNAGSGKSGSGGTVKHTIGTNMTTLITALQNTGCDTWTPLAESFYVAMQYFKQEDPQLGLDYPRSAVPNSNIGDDPWYVGSQYVECAKSFVILLTDGASTMDSEIPGEYKDYDGDGDKTSCDESTGTDCDYPDSGTDFLDDLALYSRTNDLRPDLDDEQNIILYAIYAFGNDANARSLLSDAAKNGGFEDKNNNDRPDLDVEWDEDGDGVPDTFFEASDGYELEKRLLQAITDILKRAASGTSASVLATNSEGEGHMVQAYFRASVIEGLEEARWLGFMHSLWVDAYGILHEDTNQNQQLDGADLEVEFITGTDGDTKVLRGGLEVAIEDILPIFEAGKRLAARDPDTRRIFTFVDTNNDTIVDESPIDMFDITGEAITFDTGTAAQIKPYLGVVDSSAWGDTAAKLGTTHDDRVTNIIQWVRGTDITGLRNRTLARETWRLGDIVHSTPVTVAQPPDQYHTIYADESYLAYWNAVKDRETAIYVGSNDGMLHVFTSWQYDKSNREYVQPSGTTELIGDEIWAFIPQSVLPHLKWVAQDGYTHTYLVDSKPRVFDAKILPDDTHYTDSDGDPNWGTFLVMGLNMGARHIDVEEDFGSGTELRDFYPTYFMIDITEPRNPRLMWEHTYADLSMSYSRPTPMKVDDQWYLVFGSGPTDYEGNSDQYGYLYVVDMATGQQFRRFGPLDRYALFNEPLAFDKNLNYNVDAIYAGDAFFASNKWQGSIYKIAVPCSNCEWDSAYDPGLSFGYDVDPNNWVLSKMFESDRPITAPLSASVEVSPDIGIDNVWVYFGTGSYIGSSDLKDSSQQYLYGIKDPFFNSKSGGYFHDFGSALTLDRGTLFQSDTIVTTTAGHVLQGGSLYGTSGDLQELETNIQDNDDGWYRALTTNGSDPSERIVSEPAVLGGMVFVPAFTPNTDICGFGGETTFYAVYFATGTGYTRQIFEIETPNHITVDGNSEEVVEVKLPESFLGVPPPAAGIHAGQQQGAKAFMQQSTGRVLELDLNPPFYFRGAIIDWWDL